LTIAKVATPLEFVSVRYLLTRREYGLQGAQGCRDIAQALVNVADQSCVLEGQAGRRAMKQQSKKPSEEA
jgi:hypothetical protein